MRLLIFLEHRNNTRCCNSKGRLQKFFTVSRASMRLVDEESGWTLLGVVVSI
jgi:hypothetical protein